MGPIWSEVQISSSNVQGCGGDMKRTVLMGVAMSVALALFAEDETEATEETAAEAVPAVQTNSVASVKAFTTLPLSRHVEGAVSVRKPNGEWESIEEGRFYPLGSYF